MAWGPIAAAAIGAASEMNTYKQAGDKATNMLANMYGLGTKFKDPPFIPVLPSLSQPTYPSECPSCHSHEFRMHHGRWVCSFCRSSA